MDCSICYNQIIDKVYMTCNSQHPFCFRCLLESVEVSSELKYCPNCRGGDKFILLSNNSTSTGVGFYSLDYFKKSLPILQKMLGIITNTCLVSEAILVFYVKNKKQLDIAHELIALDYSIDDVSSLIKWNDQRNLANIINGLGLNGFFEQFQTRPVIIPFENVIHPTGRGHGQSQDQNPNQNQGTYSDYN